MLAKLVELPDPGEDDQSVTIELIDGSTPSQIDINVGAELGKMGLVTYTGPHSTDSDVVSNQSEEGSW